MAKIDTWLAELEKYRNAVNGDSLHQWFGYFDLGKVVSVTANAMFASGLLYKVLDKDDIAALQKLFTDLSPAGEQYMNNQLGEYRRLFMSSRYEERIGEWIQTHKPDAGGKVDFLAEEFLRPPHEAERDHRQVVADANTCEGSGVHPRGPQKAAHTHPERPLTALTCVGRWLGSTSAPFVAPWGF